MGKRVKRYGRTALLFLGFALLGLFLIWSYAFRGKNEEKPERDPREKIFGHLTADDIQRLEITHTNESIRLRRLGTQWRLPDWQDYPADPVYARMLVSNLLRVPWGEVVTRNREKYPLYDLGADAIEVAMLNADGGSLGTVLVGKATNKYRAAYIRLPASPEIRLVTADLIPALSRITWADRTVWRMKPELISEIRARGFAADFHALKDGATQQWQLVSPPDYRLSARFFELVDRMAFLRAGNIEFTPQLPPDTTAQGLLQVTASGTHLTLYLTGLGGETVTGRRDGLPVEFRFSGDLTDLISRAMEPKKQ